MFKMKVNKDTIKEGGNSKFINASGVYDVTINFASINVAKSGAESVNFNITYNGETQVLYGPYFKKADGGYIEHSVNLLTTLGVVAGLEDGEEFDVQVEEHELGKDKKLTELDVIQQFSGLELKMHLQQEFTEYLGKIREGLVIRGFFSSEGASAEEIVNDTDKGKRLTLVEEKYAVNISYKDGLTEEDVEAWIKGGRGKGSSPAPKKAAAKTGSIFGKKS